MYIQISLYCSSPDILWKDLHWFYDKHKSRFTQIMKLKGKSYSENAELYGLDADQMLDYMHSKYTFIQGENWKFFWSIKRFQTDIVKKCKTMAGKFGLEVSIHFCHTRLWIWMFRGLNISKKKSQIPQKFENTEKIVFCLQVTQKARSMAVTSANEHRYFSPQKKGTKRRQRKRQRKTNKEKWIRFLTR